MHAKFAKSTDQHVFPFPEGRFNQFQERLDRIDGLLSGKPEPFLNRIDNVMFGQGHRVSLEMLRVEEWGAFLTTG
jgi:hypothetical protein